MATNALINIETVVSRYLFKYKKTTEDAFIYTEHICNCFRDFCLYDSDQVVTAKVTITANKIIEMPADMMGFVDLVVPIAGEWWSYTEKKAIVNTTTFTGAIEGLDEDLGEGVGVTEGRTTGYGAAGGINDYNFTIDWKARRIFVDSATTDSTVLIYVTSGIESSGTTFVPDFLTPVFDAYLNWKSSYWIPELVRERQALERDYTNARLSTRNLINSMSYNQWRDLILSSAMQAPRR